MKKLVRIVGLLVGTFLVIGIISNSGDELFARNTHLQSVIAAEDLSARLAPVSAPTGSPVQSSDLSGSQHSSNDLTQVAASQPTIAAKTGALSPGDGNSTSATAVQPPDLIQHQPRPRATSQPVVAALPVQTFPFGEFDLFIHAPPDAARQEPLLVVLALHGMGGHGDAFANGLLSEADRSGWLVIAPTLPYRDYMDPVKLAEDDVLLSQMLAATLDALPSRLGLKLQPRVLVYGFSRGAQLAHRFALFFPERVEAVVTLSAGSYTLPTDKGMTSAGMQPLPLPYGLADAEKRLNRPLNLEEFKKIPFFIAVGEKDTRASDVPRQFDAFVGTTRVERAKAFNQVLQSLGMKSQLMIAPNAGHEVSSDMHKSAVNFLKENTSAQKTRR